MLIGSTKEELNSIRNQKVDTRPFERVYKNVARPRDTSQNLPSPFGQIEILSYLRHRQAEAKVFLERIAADEGTLAVMRRHRWQVGLLRELDPAEHTILGFNRNRGQEIALRLRFEDGFRPYEDVIDVLLHELTHMVHDEHDASFHALFRQLRQERIELDWTRSNGHKLGGSQIRQASKNIGFQPCTSIFSSTLTGAKVPGLGQPGAGYVLGGDASLTKILSAKELAAQAAVFRMTEHERLLAASCGSGHDAKTVKTSGLDSAKPSLSPSRAQALAGQGSFDDPIRLEENEHDELQINRADTSSQDHLLDKMDLSPILPDTNQPKPKQQQPNQANQSSPQAVICPVCSYKFESRNPITHQAHINQCLAEVAAKERLANPTLQATTPTGICPVCSKTFTLDTIPTHIDACLATHSVEPPNPDPSPYPDPPSSKAVVPPDAECPVCYTKFPANSNGNVDLRALDLHVEACLKSI